MKCWISWMWSRWASAICICWRCTLMLYPSFPLFLSSKDKGRKVVFNLRCQDYRKYTGVAGKVRSDNVIEVYCSCASWQSLIGWTGVGLRRSVDTSITASPWDLICGLWLCGISLDSERLRIGSVDLSAVSGLMVGLGKLLLKFLTSQQLITHKSCFCQLVGLHPSFTGVSVSMETWDCIGASFCARKRRRKLKVRNAPLTFMILHALATQ